MSDTSFYANFGAQKNSTIHVVLVFCLFLGISSLKVQRFVAKIGFANEKSVQLFTKLGFKEVNV